MTKAILLTSLLLGACTVGEVQTGRPGNGPDAGGGGIDSPGGGGIDAPPGALLCADRGTPGAAHIHTAAPADARAGQPCVVSGCHSNNGTGNGASVMQFAGTAYIKGTQTPDPGAVIIIIPDGGGNPIKMVADDAGNFKSGPPVQGSMPASAAASVCPTITKGHTVGKLAGGTAPGSGGDCNGCHGNTQPVIYVGP